LLQDHAWESCLDCRGNLGRRDEARLTGHGKNPQLGTTASNPPPGG
jgi:hypothetical protein